MVEELLVSAPREAAWNILSKLDEASLQITVAYWKYREDAEEWVFRIASPLVAKDGPLFIIQQIHKILDEMPESEKGDLVLTDFSVVNPHLREIDELRSRRGPINLDRSSQIRRKYISHDELDIYRLN